MGAYETEAEQTRIAVKNKTPLQTLLDEKERVLTEVPTRNTNTRLLLILRNLQSNDIHTP